MQVLLSAPSPNLAWGHEFFDPIWEACVRNDLAVDMHLLPSAGPVSNPTGAGFPQTYLETRATYPDIAQTQLISMVVNGVFVKFPDLRLAFVECGFTWLPSVMWRLDQCRSSLRMETPWLTRRPSETIRERVRLTTQPFDEIDQPRHLMQVIDQMGSEEMLMFSSDFPPWDLDSPERSLPDVLGRSSRARSSGTTRAPSTACLSPTRSP